MSSPAKRVLLVTRNFPPLWGGMEKLNWHLAAELSRTCHVRVIGPEGAARSAPQGVEVRELPLRPLSKFLRSAALCACREAAHWRPDVVLAGSGLTAPLAWLAARAGKGQAMAYVHGLDLAARHPLYRLLWRPALRRMDRLIANSNATAALATGIGVPSERLRIVHPGVELPDPDPRARARFREAQRLADVPVLLSVGRLTARKGLREFVADVLPRIVARRPDVQLVIVGGEPNDALYAQAQTPASIQEAAVAVGVQANVRFLGPLFGADLLAAYAGADVHVFPVRALPGDPEGFGMVAVEAAAYGVPTVAYATGGVCDAVMEGVSGRLVAPGDAAGMAAAVLDALATPWSPETLRAFAGGFAWNRFGGQMLSALGLG
ncbi:glycosyltransferase family 4 protein [Fulvimonas yonginensis]|uniref:Glycosyltransferase family 4 protein n=1 Tax=Fulvimonas yonginensis TaxID=1495200 RepID=A0ABU8J9A0_9GAMM